MFDTQLINWTLYRLTLSFWHFHLKFQNSSKKNLNFNTELIKILQNDKLLHLYYAIILSSMPKEMNWQNFKCWWKIMSLLICWSFLPFLSDENWVTFNQSDSRRCKWCPFIGLDLLIPWNHMIIQDQSWW